MDETPRDWDELRRRFGAMIRQHRRALIPDVAQREVAEHLQVAQATVSDWERGKAWPTVPYLIALLKFLDLDPRLLLALIENDPENDRPDGKDEAA